MSARLWASLPGPCAIRHKRTQVASPQTNGFRERFHRTIQEEFYSVKFRQKIYQLSGLLQSP
ncbi:MAG: integrase core domain-containing protein, partial [Acidobacteriota bacterium]